MPRVTFGRTETRNSGWKGKQSATPIRLDGQEVGVIRGYYSGPKLTVYQVREAAHAELRLLPSAYNLRDMKRAVLEALSP